MQAKKRSCIIFAARADQALTEARDRAAGLHRAGDVNDRARRRPARSVMAASPFTKPGAALSFDRQAVRRLSRPSR